MGSRDTVISSLAELTTLGNWNYNPPWVYCEIPGRIGVRFRKEGERDDS